MEDKIIYFDKDTPTIADANKVRSMLAVNGEDGTIGSVDFDLLVIEAGKNVNDSVKVSGLNLPTLGAVNKKTTVRGGALGKNYSYTDPVTSVVSTFNIGKNMIADLYWDANLKSWSKGEEDLLPTVEGKEFLDPTGNDIPSESATAKYVNPLFKLTKGGKNLADKTTFIAGQWGVGGDILGNNWIRMPLIDLDAWGISEGEYFAIKGGKALGVTQNQAIFYKNSSFSDGAAILSNGTDGIILQRPVGYRFVGVNVDNTLEVGLDPTKSTYYNTFMISKGASYIAYEPFGLIIPLVNVEGLHDEFANKELFDSFLYQSYNRANRELIGYGPWAANGNLGTGNNWIHYPPINLSEYTDDDILDGIGGISAAGVRIVYMKADNTVAGIKNGNGASDFSPVFFKRDRPEGAVVAKVNIANDLYQEGVLAKDSKYAKSFMIRKFSDPSTYVPFGYLINGNKISNLPDQSGENYDLREVILEKYSATTYYLYYHNGNDSRKWQRLSIINRINPEKFIDMWSFGELRRVDRNGDVFTLEAQIVANGMWENAIYTAGGGYTDALGGLHGCEIKNSISLFIGNKKINMDGTDVRWTGSDFQMYQNSAFKSSDGLNDVGTSMKAWHLKDGIISISQEIKWNTNSLTPGWNSYLSMLSINRMASGEQITHTGMSNTENTPYDISTEGFTNPLAVVSVSSGSNNPERTRLVVWGDRVRAEMEIVKREVLLPDGTIFPKGFYNPNDATYRVPSMYVQNTSLYNKLYGSFGGHLLSVGEVWRTKTVYNITVS